jgi:hypothetical protein
MNATSVMNNGDLLSREIIPFATAPKPSNCDKCKKLGTDLHLHKQYSAEHFFAHPRYSQRVKAINQFPKELRETEEDIDMIECVMEDKIENQYLCSTCFCERLEIKQPYGILNGTKNSIKAFIREEHPEWDEKKLTSAVNREMKLITEDKLLFKKHRVRKTQEKADEYEVWVYNDLRNQFKQVKQTQKDIHEGNKKAKSECFEKMKMIKCASISRELVKEIKMTLIAKWFANKKIPYEFFAWVTGQRFNHHELPSWKRFADDYEQHAEWESDRRRRCPPLPAWFKEL